MIFPKTFRWRIQTLYAALFALLVSLLAVSSYREQRTQYIASVDAFLNVQIRYLLPRFIPHSGGPPPGRPPRGRSGTDVVEDAEKQRAARNGYHLIFRQGVLAEKSDKAPDMSAPVAAPGVIDIVRWHQGNREAIHFSPGGDLLITGVPAESVSAGLSQLRWHLLLPAFAAWAVALLGGWWIVRHGLRPLQRMSDNAREIANGKRDTRIDVPQGGSELAHLSATLNATFDRLDDSYDRQKRFTADAAHELGTPVSIIISQTQLALARPREATQYIAALESCARAGQRMRSLTGDLLDLAEYDAGIPAARLVSCDLAEIAHETIDELRPFAKKNQARIDEDLASAPGCYHPSALSQVFSNLIQNAIKHNPPGITITLITSSNSHVVSAEVRDTGAGIPEADLHSIFDRFHRGDKSRSQERGGSGLGLAICKTIIEAHGGTITVANAPDGGACVHFKLPIAPRN